MGVRRRGSRRTRALSRDHRKLTVAGWLRVRLLEGNGSVSEQQAKLALSPVSAEAVQRALASLRRDTNAQYVSLAARDGSVIADAGSARGLRLESVLKILAEEISIAARLNRSWGKGSVLSLHHYEGRQYEVYAAAAADLPYLLLALTWQRSPAYSGVIWLFVRRTMQELRSLLRVEMAPAEAGAAELGLDVGDLGGLTPAQAQALGLLAEDAIEEGGKGEEN